LRITSKAVYPVDLVHSNTHLLDGTGYRLLMNLACLPGSALFCFPVEMSCLWLPAINGGKQCLGCEKTGMPRTTLNLPSDSQFANCGLAPSARGDSQEKEKAPNLWNGGHFGIINIVHVHLLVKLCDLIVNEPDFCS
jgi:hypothetical protein